ncbi:MAG: helix-turn-helix domain-containing protein [Solirubrobacteraceae bacterium]
MLYQLSYLALARRSEPRHCSSWSRFPGSRKVAIVDKRSLAQALRSLRMERGLTLNDVAAATTISSSFLSLVEQGRSDITISRLLRLAEFYDVEITELIAGDISTPPDPITILRPDPDNVIHSDAEAVDVYGLAGDTRWTVVPVLAIHEPGGPGIEVNDEHEREALLFVLEGTFELTFEEREPIRLRKGEGAVYRSFAPYRVRNVSKRIGRILAVGLHAPVGRSDALSGRRSNQRRPAAIR